MDFGEFPVGLPGPIAAGPGTVSFSTSGTTITETVTQGSHSHSVTFTQESGNSSLYMVSGSGATYGFSGIGGSSVTETVTGGSVTTSLTFDEVSGGSYQLASETTSRTASSSAPMASYSFSESGGKVTGLSETLSYDGTSKTVTLTLPSDAVFTIASGSITETLASRDQVDTLTYSAGSTGSYSLSSITANFLGQKSATTILDIQPEERAQFTISGSSVTAMAEVSPNGTVTALSANSHVSFSLLAPGYVEVINSYGSQTSYELFYSASGSGTYTAIAHGSGSSVDLVGVKADLALLPASVAALL